MNEAALTIGLAVFFASLALHIIVWRIFKPKAHLSALIIVFIIVPAALFLIGAITMPLSGYFALSMEEWALVALLHASLVAAYIMTYPAMQASCPTLSILIIAGRNMPNGSAYEDLKSAIGPDELLTPRIDDLVSSGLAVKDGMYFTLTKKGAILSAFFDAYRRFMSLEAGKG